MADITGTVTDGTDPIEGATVSTVGATDTTDATGAYVLTVLDNDTYQVTASADGYADSTEEVVVVTTNVVQNFTLTADAVANSPTFPPPEPTYIGHRPVLPGQYWEEGVYSYHPWKRTIQLLQDAPIHDHTPGEGYHPHGTQLTRAFLGLQNDSPMYNEKFVHGGQNVPYVRHINWKFLGVPAGEIFSGDWGHDGTRELTTSRWSNLKHKGVPSTVVLFGDPDDFKETPSWWSTGKPYTYEGVTQEALEDPGSSIEDKVYGFNKPKEWLGVDSAKVL